MAFQGVSGCADCTVGTPLLLRIRWTSPSSPGRTTTSTASTPAVAGATGRRRRRLGAREEAWRGGFDEEAHPEAQNNDGGGWECAETTNSAVAFSGSGEIPEKLASVLGVLRLDYLGEKMKTAQLGLLDILAAREEAGGHARHGGALCSLTVAHEKTASESGMES
jgi:hypothetical protein